MVRLVYSNRTEELLTELGARVRSQQARDGALLPVRIVVPGRSLETHVRLGIAREQGIAANLDVQLLTRFAGAVAAPPGARIADASALSAMALQLLLDEAALAAPDLGPVLGYLRAAGDSADAMDLRRVQLASRVGRIFEEYTYSRGEMLSAWKTGPVHDPPRAEVERWQRRLWLAMFGIEGLALRAAPRLVPLHEAVAAMTPTAEAFPSAIHVFGFAHVARTFHQLLAHIGRATEVVVYTLSPCEGFWEDVDPRDPPLLSLWSRPGRENVRALNASAGFDHEDRFVDPQGPQPTLLQALQSDLLHRRGAPAALLGDDRSLVVLEHASIRRECEAVASAIWQAVRDDPTLTFDAISVLVPQSEAAVYAAHLGAAFHEANDIPHQSLGLPDAMPGRIAGAIELLLALPLGRFTRREVLEVLVHPSVVASVADADPEADPEQWLAWCEALGIVHGADHADHDGTYIEHDILNWDQGLRRLSLGAFMTGEASGEPTPFAVGEEAYLPHELSGTELHEAATFGLLARSLLADARFARNAVLTPPQWADLLGAMVETYVAPTDDGEADELSRRLRQLGGLAEVELGGRAVGYRVASELARARIAGVAASRGGEGVLVSTIGAARGIPARVVFACGLGEGRFPTADAEDPLDLRSLGTRPERREGDVTARERDKYAFLEVLLGVRDRLVLSYVSRDPLTGDALSASSVVQELLHTLATSYGRDAAALRRRHPLRRWDPVYFPALLGHESSGPGPLGTMELPEARAEAVTLALRRSAEACGTHLALHDVVSRADGGDPAWTSLAEHLRVARLPQAAPVTDARVTVPMHALVKFLELPLQGWARFRLGLDEIENEDLASRESEPFETAPRDETLLLRDVLLDAAERKPAGRGAPTTTGAGEPRATGHRARRASSRSGERGDRTDALEDVACRARAASGAAPKALQIHRFGRGGRAHARDQVHEPARRSTWVWRTPPASLRVVRAEIGGRALPVGGDPDRTSVRSCSRSAAAGRKDDWAVAGRPRSVDRCGRSSTHAVLVASGAGGHGPHASAPRGLDARPAPSIERVLVRARSRVDSAGPLAARPAARSCSAHPTRTSFRARRSSSTTRRDRTCLCSPLPRGERATGWAGTRPTRAAIRLRSRVPRPHDLPAPRRGRRARHDRAPFCPHPRRAPGGSMSARRAARPALLGSIPLNRHAVIEASAGTGKTFTLEHLIVEARARRRTLTLDQVLVVTFTEKATHELRVRVRVKLEELLRGQAPEPDAAAITRGDFWTLDDVARRKLERALHAFDGATIATIHAFCQRVLRDNAFASGRLFEESQVDGRDAFGRALRDALRRDVAPDPIRAPWLEAGLRAGWAPRSPRSKACSGSCSLARGELRPVFDPRALGAAIEAFPVEDALLRNGVDTLKSWGVHGQTAKKLGNQPVRTVSRLVERARDLAHIRPRWWSSQGRSRSSTCSRSFRAWTGRDRRVVRAWPRSRSPRSPPRSVRRSRTSCCPPCVPRLARRKQQAGQYDFDDMLSLVQDGLRGARADALVRSMRERYRFVLIDEFQDTDETQWDIFRRAFFEPADGTVPRTVLHLVGRPEAVHLPIPWRRRADLPAGARRGRGLGR